MIDLAGNYRPGNPVVLRDIAERQQISKRYLEQVAVTLKHAGLVLVSVGRGGGYALPRSADNIGVDEIIRATIGEINVVDCVNHPEGCERIEKCPSRIMWQRLNNAINQTFDEVSLADLCERKLIEEAHPAYELPAPCARDARLRLVR